MPIRHIQLSVAALLLMLMFAVPAAAQKGIGEPTGVAGQAVKPPIETIARRSEAEGHFFLPEVDLDQVRAGIFISALSPFLISTTAGLQCTSITRSLASPRVRTSASRSSRTRSGQLPN
jgi:hypothetical protein